MAKKYIDAEAAIETIKTGCYPQTRGNYEFESDYMRAMGYNAGLDRAVHDLAGLPSADVAPVRHGRWVLIRPGEWTATLKCSECGRHITVDPKQGDLLKDYPYCHCGAQMDGKEADSHAQD